MKRWNNLSDFQANEFVDRSFNQAFDAIDVLQNGQIAQDEMYQLIKRVRKG